MSKPIFYFDETCSFCRYWTARWKQHVGERVEFRAFEHPEQKTSTEYIDEQGKMFTGAQGVVQLLSHAPGAHPFLFLYQHVRVMRWGSDGLYRLVSSCRTCGEQALPYVLLLAMLFFFIVCFFLIVR